MSHVHFIPRPAPEAVSTLDFGHLNRLQRGVRAGGSQQLAHEQQVAQQFEALLIQQLLKQGRQASGTGSLFDSQQTRLAQGMSDDQMAMQLANPGLGLAQALMEQIRAARGATETGDPAHTLPDLAATRLPHLRSSIEKATAQDKPDHDRPVVSSISELLSLLARPANVVEYVAGAIRGAPSHIRSFVDKMGAAARHAAAESGVPARLILSQAALESGWGRREIKDENGATSHNLFGIKATGGWEGKVVNIMTTEFENGVARKVKQPFRAYDSDAEAFADYARLISKNGRYRDVLTAPSAEEAAHRIQAAGYATDPAYADKLISIMSYFDRGTAKAG